MTIQSQLDQVLALVDQFALTGRANWTHPKREVFANELRSRLSEIRAAVGGEAVAWRMMRANGKPYTGWKDLPVPEWASINVDDGMRLEYAYASSPATVDVGALEVNKNRWTCPNCNKVNPTFDPWCSACETPQPAASIDASSLRELAEDWRNRVRAIGRDTGGYKTCADELAALIGEKEDKNFRTTTTFGELLEKLP